MPPPSPAARRQFAATHPPPLLPLLQRARPAALTCRAVASGPAKSKAPKDSLDALIAEAIVHPPEQHSSSSSDGEELYAGPDVEVRRQSQSRAS